MSVTIGSAGAGEVVIAIDGELDLGNVAELERKAAHVFEQPPPAVLVVDLSGLRFADSSAIATLVRWSALVGELRLVSVSPLLRRVIQTMGLGEWLGMEA